MHILRCLNGLNDKLWGGVLGEWVNLCSVHSTGGKSIAVLLNILLLQPQLVACLEIKKGGLFFTGKVVPTCLKKEKFHSFCSAFLVVKAQKDVKAWG